MTARRKREKHDLTIQCSKRSPGGVTRTGTLPTKGTRCRLEQGHDGRCSILASSAYRMADGRVAFPWNRGIADV